MKKKLYFDNRIDLDIDFYVEIDGGKIKRFVGANMHDMFIMAVLDSGQIAQKDIRKIDIHISSNFTLQ